jgi:hypothetical protein
MRDLENSPYALQQAGTWLRWSLAGIARYAICLRLHEAIHTLLFPISI